MHLSVISPVYRAEACIIPLYEGITDAVRSMDDFDDYEIIFVEDCGGDNSWNLIRQIAAEDPHVIGVQLSRNFGQHHALTAGWDISRGDWAVIMDCDLQDNPRDIPALWAEAKKGYKVVLARRVARAHALGRKVSSRMLHVVLEWLSGMKLDPHVANFRIIERQVIEVYGSMHEAVRNVGAQIQWMGFKTSFVNLVQDDRFEGRSSYTLRKLFALAGNTIVSYSNKPLRYSIAVGLVMAVVAAGISIWAFLRTVIWGIPVPGWASLMVSLWFIGGIIIANLGIIGIYIGKIYTETKDRPIYIISERVN